VLPPLLKPYVLRLGLPIHRGVGVSVLPETEKVLVGGTSLSLVAFQKISARQPQVCQRSQREIQHDAAMIDNLLEFRRRFCSSMRQEVRLPATTAFFSS